MNTLYVRVRTDNGVWREPSRLDDEGSVAHFAACAVATYSFTVACEDDDFSQPQVFQWSATVPEAPLASAYCGYPREPAGTIVVEGIMRQVGSVAIGTNEYTSQTPDWRFMVPVGVTGLYDIVAANTVKISIQREAEIAGPTELPTIDLDRDGVDTIGQDLVVGDTSATTRFDTRLLLITSLKTYSGVSSLKQAKLKSPPPGILVDGDELRLTMSAEDVTAGVLQRRRTERTYHFGSNQIALLPRLSPLLLPSGTPLAVNLAGMAPIQDAWAVLDNATVSVRFSATFSPEWIAETQSLNLGFDLPDDLDYDANMVGARAFSLIVNRDTERNFTSVAN